MNIKEMFIAPNSNEILFNEIRNYLSDCSDVIIRKDNGHISEYGMAFEDGKFITFSIEEEKIKVYKNNDVQLSFDKGSPLILFLEQFLMDLDTSNSKIPSDSNMLKTGILYPEEQVHEVFRKIVVVTSTLEPDGYLKGHRALTFASEILLYLKNHDCSLDEIKDVLESLEKVSPVLQSIKEIEKSNKEYEENH